MGRTPAPPRVEPKRKSGADRPSDAAHATDDAKHSRVRDRLLWVWPVAATIAMAILGQVLGPIGTVVAAAIAIASLVAFVGADYVPSASASASSPAESSSPLRRCSWRLRTG